MRFVTVVVLSAVQAGMAAIPGKGDEMEFKVNVRKGVPLDMRYEAGKGE